MPLSVGLAIHGAPAADLDNEIVGERIDHRHADAVQPAGGDVGLAFEFAAGMQRRHDHFEGGFVFEFRVRVDGDAAAIIVDRQIAVLMQFDLDARRMARNRLVHGVVEDFGEEVMQRLFVGAANIHARAFADGFEPLKDLDVLGGVVFEQVGLFFAGGAFCHEICL